MIGFAWGTMGSTLQTVPRAELMALISLLDATTGGRLEVFVDADYVVKGFKKGPNFEHKSNTWLWDKLWEVISNREGDIEVTKVTSHLKAKDIADGRISAWSFWLNHLADAVADRAAAEARLSIEIRKMSS